jgi:LytS/YehU family sensor histidine kinase
VALDEEISMLKKYILLEQQRLDQQFDYKIEIADDLQADFFEIPGMIIQPYVENAIWHGLMNKQEKGLLRLWFEKTGAYIKCVIEDNGVGREKAAAIALQQSPRKKSYGMSIAQKRLELLEKEKMEIPRIHVEDLYEGTDPAGTRVTIYIHAD